MWYSEKQIAVVNINWSGNLKSTPAGPGDSTAWNCKGVNITVTLELFKN